MVKSWTDAAWEDFEYWMKQDKKTLKRMSISSTLSIVLQEKTEKKQWIRI